MVMLSCFTNAAFTSFSKIQHFPIAPAECGLNELEYQLASKYGVIFESKQSYYDLFKEARISWKKSQANNPKHDPELVAVKKKKLANCWRGDDPKSNLEN